MYSGSYYFYCDESYHDRKIKISKNKKLNIKSNDNMSDTYIYTLIGVKSSYLKDFEKQYLKFEEKYKSFFEIDDTEELKGTTIKKKNFKSGLASLNPNSIKFYSDYFDLLIKFNIISYLYSQSKIEYLVTKAIGNDLSKIPNHINMRAFIYSITKFIYQYDDLKLAEKFLLKDSISSEYMIKEIKNGIKLILNKTENIDKKYLERIALNELLNLFNIFKFNSSLDEEIHWDYDNIFLGFNIMIRELNLNVTEIKIDKESSVLDAAIKNTKFKNINDYDSKDVIGIRCADIFSNFFGRLAHSIEFELKEDNSNNISSEKKYISKGWFDLNENQFMLFKKLIQISNFKNLYCNYFGIYFDYIMIIFIYIEYINQFESFDDYMRFKDVHYKEGNDYILLTLNEFLDSL